MPALWEGSYGPVTGVEKDISGCIGDLQFEFRIGESDDAEHEHEGANQGDDSVELFVHAVDAFFGSKVELARDFLVAFDDIEGTLWVFDHNVSWGDDSFGTAFGEFEGPFGTDTDE